MQKITTCPECWQKFEIEENPDNEPKHLLRCCPKCAEKRRTKLKELDNLKGGQETTIEQQQFRHETRKPIKYGRKGQVWWQRQKGRGGK